MTLLLKFRNHVSERKLISFNDHILMGVSGGADSMVLCHLMSQLQDEYQLKLSVIHVQHHLRKDAEADAQFVKSFCEMNRISFYREDIDPSSKRKNQSTEAWARKNRYLLFNKCKNAIEADKIVTAHHGDDQIETILLHIADGSGMNGVLGIREEMKYIIRPLLPFSRQEIKAYAGENNLHFVEDSTNNDLSHPRNYLRKNIIPNWKQQTPGLVSSVRTLTENVRESKEVMDFLIQKSISDYVEFVSKDRMIIASIDDGEEPASFRSYLIKSLIARNELWRRHDWMNLKEFIQRSCTGTVLSINHYALLKDRGRIIIQKEMRRDEKVYTVHAGDDFSTNHFRFSWTPTESVDIERANHEYETVDAEKLCQNVHLRIWESRDRFQPLGMEGHKKMSDFLVDCKMDRFQKNDQYVLANDSEILWVCGQRISERIKITEHTTQMAELSFHTVVA
ncbi:MAG: tRNA lysidine(34) synthetase TilS [Fidelibacterota bacterium]